MEHESACFSVNGIKRSGLTRSKYVPKSILLLFEGKKGDPISKYWIGNFENKSGLSPD
jgi:hypothetical protein